LPTSPNYFLTMNGVNWKNFCRDLHWSLCVWILQEVNSLYLSPCASQWVLLYMCGRPMITAMKIGTC
jgi:hypothetical protein